jgi:membrane-associated phospholipid phosphatase
VSVRPLIAMPRDAAASAERKATLASRFRACLELKLGLYLLLTSIFCVPYFAIQRLPWLHPHKFSSGYIDTAIGFHPVAIYAYQSAYLLIPMFPFLATTREDLLRFTKGFLWLCAVCFFAFLVFPVLGPRPEHAQGNRMTQIVFSYDKNLNVFPSLHVGLAVYSVLFGFTIARGCQQLRWLAMVGALWAGLIMISTVATRQHYFVDIPPAVALAWIAHRWVWLRA